VTELVWPLVGRADEVQRVASLLAAGEGAGVVFVGAAGVGKTRLAEECLNAAAAAGYATARVQASRAARTIPFGAFSSLLPATLDDDGEPVEQRTLRAGRAAVAALSHDGRPPVILVDDAHLLDNSSAVLLHQCAVTRAARLVVTVRSGVPASDPVMALWKDGLAERVDVGPLSRAAVSDLVERALAGPVDGRLLRDLWNATGGNALFVRELVLDTLQAGTLRSVNGLWTLAGSLVAPSRLVEVIEARLAGLRPDELEVVDFLAIGEPIGIEVLRALTSAPAIEAVEVNGLLDVRAEGDRVQVRLVHPLHGDALRANMPEARARAYRQSLADALEATSARRRADALVIATLRLDGGGSVDPALTLSAAREAFGRFDLAMCERLARIAWDAGASPEAAILLAEAADGQERYSDAIRLYKAALASATGDEQVLIAAKGVASVSFWGLRDVEAARVANEDGLARLDPGVWRDELLCQRATFAVLGGSFDPGLSVLCDLIDTSNLRPAADAAVTAAPALAIAGRTAEALRVAERGAAIQSAMGEQQLMLSEQGVHVVGMVLALTEAGRLDEAWQLGELGYVGAIDEGIRVGQAWFALMLGRVALYQGRFATADRWFIEGAGVFTRRADIGPRRWCLGGMVRARAELGDVAGATVALDLLHAIGPSAVLLMEPDLDRAAAWLLLRRGEVAMAHRGLLAAAESAARSGRHTLEAGALHDLARAGEAEAVTARLCALAAETDSEIVRARAAHAAALAAHDPAALEAVAHQFAAMGAVVHAFEAAQAASAEYRAHGDARLATQCERLADALGERCEAAVVPASVVRPEGRLTRREDEVARLAADGLASRDIAVRLSLSVRTVDNHLQHVYVKLGVSTRAALANALALAPHPA
jgi:DNA-binding CsgD family transcriptional regulator